MKKSLLSFVLATLASLCATAQCSMKRRFLQTVLVGWCLLSAAPVAAQVFYAPPIFGGNVIVRSIDRDMRLVYTDGPVGKFSLITPVDTLYFNLPIGLVIKDLEVANGWAFFCGTRTGFGTQDGVVGQFRIFDVYAGTGSVNYAVFDTTSYSLTSYFFKTLSFDRLDVFFTSVNDPYIALTGDITCDTINPATSLRKTVACAHYNGSSWYLEVVCNKNDYSCASISQSATIFANPIMNMSVIKHCY